MTDPHTLPPLSFAPLEGITGWIFRQVHHAMFPGLSRYYTPFFAPTADSPLTGRGLRDMHPDHNRGVPVVPQLLTNRAEDFIASARLLQDLGYKEVNLNLGCPSGTAVPRAQWWPKRRAPAFSASLRRWHVSWTKFSRPWT